SGTVVTVEVFVEQDVVAEVRVALELFGAAVDGAESVGVAQEEMGQAPGEFGGGLAKVDPAAGAGGELDFEFVAEVMVVLLQRFDHEVVDRKPDRAAPVGVAAEQAGGGFGGLVINAVGFAVNHEVEGI